MKKICSIGDCDRFCFGHGYCSKHYTRFRIHGDANIVLRKQEYHGLSVKNKTEYSSWQHMKSRCYNKNDKKYPIYGGRGIKVCDEWINSFANFMRDVGEKPTEKHTIDRKNVNGNYEPSNCVWSNKSVQQINRNIQSNNTSGAIGVQWCKQSKKWVAIIQFEHKSKHLGFFNNQHDAIIARQNEFNRIFNNVYQLD